MSLVQLWRCQALTLSLSYSRQPHLYVPRCSKPHFFHPRENVGRKTPAPNPIFFNTPGQVKVEPHFFFNTPGQVKVEHHFAFCQILQNLLYGNLHMAILASHDSYSHTYPTSYMQAAGSQFTFQFSQATASQTKDPYNPAQGIPIF